MSSLLNPYWFVTSTPEEPGEGAFPGIYMNFLTETYTVDGAVTPVSDLLTNPSRVDPTYGLVISDSDHTGLSYGVERLKGEAESLLCSKSFTVVIEFLSAPIYQVILNVQDQTENNEFSIQTERRSPSGNNYVQNWGVICWDYDSDMWREIDNVTFDDDDVGVTRVAVTRINNKLVMSVNGGDVVIDETADMGEATFTRAILGAAQYDDDDAWVSTDCVIRELRIMDPVDDADLPALSENTFVPGSSIPSWVPQAVAGVGDAVVWMDFTNRRFYANGSPQILPALIYRGTSKDTVAYSSSEGLDYGSVRRPLGYSLPSTGLTVFADFQVPNTYGAVGATIFSLSDENYPNYRSIGACTNVVIGPPKEYFVYSEVHDGVSGDTRTPTTGEDPAFAPDELTKGAWRWTWGSGQGVAVNNDDPGSTSGLATPLVPAAGSIGFSGTGIKIYRMAIFGPPDNDSVLQNITDFDSPLI